MNTDCIIIGAGITGLAASLKLADLGYSSVLVDRAGHCKAKAGETLTPYCYHFFKSLGIDLSTEQYSFEYRSKKINWSKEAAVENIAPVAPFSYSVDRLLMEGDLLNRSMTYGNSFFRNTRILSIKYFNGQWDVQLVNKNIASSILAKFLLIATGRGQFKLIPELKRQYYDDLVAWSVITENCEEQTATGFYLESIHDGWVYSNALPAGKNIFTAFSDRDLLVHKQGLPAQFSHLWGQSSCSLPLELLQVNLFDARTYWTSIQSGKGWIMLGDAAYAIDPLSGMGIEKNLEMINSFTDRINGFLNHNIKIAKEYVLLNKLHFESYMKERAVVFESSKVTASEFWKRRRVGTVVTAHI